MKNVKMLCMVIALVMFATLSFAPNASAGRICINAGGYIYDITYTTHEGTYDITGKLVGYNVMFAGTADTNSSGQIIIGLTTMWPWTTGGLYIDPTSEVIINYTLGTYNIVYHGASLPPRPFAGNISIVACGAVAEADGPGENEK